MSEKRCPPRLHATLFPAHALIHPGRTGRRAICLTRLRSMSLSKVRPAFSSVQCAHPKRVTVSSCRPQGGRMRVVCELHLDVRGVPSEFHAPHRAHAHTPTDHREAGLHQVEAPDDAPTHLHPQARPNRLSGGGCRWLLSRAMDPLDDYLIRPCVPLVLLDLPNPQLLTRRRCLIHNIHPDEGVLP